MKLDIWKSALDGRALLSVPAGVEPWSVVEPAKLPWHMQDIRLFRRGLDAVDSPLASEAVVEQIRQRGFALHVGLIP